MTALPQGRNAKPGIFFEAGALDGERASRTLHLERFLGWTGLNAEMTWPNVRRFLAKRRKCWFAPVCVSARPWPTRRHMRFAYSPEDPWLERTGTISRHKWDVADAVHTKEKLLYVYTVVDCFPLYSLLRALNATRVDFLSLDVEGVELQVLKTLPFEKLEVKVIVIETAHTEEGPEEVRRFMRDLGYSEVTFQDMKRQNIEGADELRGFFFGQVIFFKGAG